MIRCYECGDHGHLSFECPKNILGDRARPEKKEKKKKKKLKQSSEGASVQGSHDQDSDEEEEEDDWSLGDAIKWLIL